jgi:succinylglutamic semialdehyde dehydrogenase
VLDAQAALLAAGGRALVEARHLRPGTGLLSAGLVDVTDVSDRPDEEVFGPLLQLVRVDGLDAAIAEAARTAYGLAAGILTDDEGAYRRFAEGVRAGVVNWNHELVGASSRAPFGGVGLSGNHRPSALFAADYCSYPVASIERPELALPDEPFPGLVPGLP